MKQLLSLFARSVILLVLSFGTARAHTALEHALEAQARLGAEVWSQVIRIENRAPAKGFPRVVHALVFELADILWIYDAAHGTQSFSLHKGRLAQEKADFAPLLRDIHPGFAGWRVIDGRAHAPRPQMVLRNGCLIESVVALRARLLSGSEVVRPQLLSYYVKATDGIQGHTVLAYETGDVVEIVDSAEAGKRFTFPAAWARDAVKLATALLGQKVLNARVVSLEPVLAKGLFAIATVAGAIGVGAGAE